MSFKQRSHCQLSAEPRSRKETVVVGHEQDFAISSEKSNKTLFYSNGKRMGAEADGNNRQPGTIIVYWCRSVNPTLGTNSKMEFRTNTDK